MSSVTTTLQSYADRGVFRGFRAIPGPGGRIDYQWVWLTRRPMSAVFDPRTRLLTFPALFSGIDQAAAHALKAIVASRRDRGQPAHRRIDARRARVTMSARQGDTNLIVQIRGAHHEYAVKSALNLINEMFVWLQERQPEYLIQHFGLSPE